MLTDSCQPTVEDVSRQRVMKDHCDPLNGNRRLSQLFTTAFQQGSYERSCFGGTMRVPHFTYFRTVQCLSDSEAMKFHRPFCGDELQYLKREFLQTRFKVQSCVVNFRKRFIRLAAQVLDTPDEQPTLPAEFAVNRTLRTASQLDDLVDGDTVIAALEKQVRCDFLKLAVSDFSSRPLVRHSSLQLSVLNAGKNISCNPPLESPVPGTFYATCFLAPPCVARRSSCNRMALCCTVRYSTLDSLEQIAEAVT